jgi:hypothetical protein
MVHTLDEIDQAMCRQLDQVPRVGVRLLYGTVFGIHKLKDRQVLQGDGPASFSCG